VSTRLKRDGTPSRTFRTPLAMDADMSRLRLQ
jgi:hypothetical protein